MDTTASTSSAVPSQLRTAFARFREHALALEHNKADIQKLMNEDSYFSFFFNVWKFTGTVIPHILPQILLATLLAAAVYIWDSEATSAKDSHASLAIPTNGHVALGT